MERRGKRYLFFRSGRLGRGVAVPGRKRGQAAPDEGAIVVLPVRLLADLAQGHLSLRRLLLNIGRYLRRRLSL